MKTSLISVLLLLFTGAPCLSVMASEQAPEHLIPSGLYVCRTLKGTGQYKKLRVSKEGAVVNKLAPGVYQIYHSSQHGECYVVAVPDHHSKRRIAIAGYDTLYRYAQDQKIAESELSYEHVVAANLKNVKIASEP